MLRSDWLSCYWAICYSPLVAKSARHIYNVLAAKKDLSLALTTAIKMFFFLPTSWILLKQLANSPYGLLTQE